jgi:hypothetical protein
MAADIERWVLPRQLHCMVELAAVSHESCRCKDSFAVGFDDAFVHIAGKTEVVGVDNE